VTKYRRTSVIGADFATNVDKVGLRGEVSYHQPAPPSADDIFDKRPYASAVVGVDRNLSDQASINVQYLVHYVFGSVEFGGLDEPNVLATARKAALLNNQLRQAQHGASFRAVYTAFNETLALELAAVGYATDRSAVFRPKASYAVTDAVKVVMGADVFVGTADSFFGLLRKNRIGYVELRYGF
jgi:hypothetical protein